MTAAAQALRTAADAGVVVRLVGGRPKAFGQPGPELLALLRAHKDEIAELLRAGDSCRRCGKPLPPAPAPLGVLVVFGDDSLECQTCADAEVGRLLKAGRHAVDHKLASDPAECMLRGEID